ADRNAGQSGGDQQFPTGDRCPSAPGKIVAEPSADDRSDTAEEVRDGTHNSHPRDAHVALVLQVERQPTGIEPERIDRSKKPGDHSPRGPMSEELLPLGEGRRARCRILVAFCEVAALVWSETKFRRIAMNAPP